MILDINSKTRVQVYAHHAFVNAIIDRNRANKEPYLLRIKVPNVSEYEWNKIESDAKVILENDQFLMLDKPEISNTETYIYRDCKPEDELILKIEDIKLEKPDGIINIFVTGDDFKECIKTSVDIYQLGFIENRMLTRVNENFIINQTLNTNKYVWMKVRRSKDIVFSYISTDGIDWEEIEKQRITVEEDKAKIGISVKFLGEDNLNEQYENWLAMNYVQLFYNKQDTAGRVWLDYKMFPTKRYRYEYVIANHFMDIDYVEPNEVVEVYGSLTNYIIWCLEHNYYVSVCMNEYYIPKRTSYQKYFYLHHNLIYGYDETTHEFCMLGYATKLEDSRASFEEVEKATTKMNGTIMRYKRIRNYCSIDFDLGYMISILEDYIYSKDSSRRFCNLLVDQPGSYGINILKEMYTDKLSQSLLLEDRRISYILYEHCQLMHFRFDFLKQKGLIKDDCVEGLECKCMSMLECSTKVKNMVNKNQIKSIYKREILNYVKQLYEVEYDFYSELIAQLRRKL